VVVVFLANELKLRPISRSHIAFAALLQETH